MSSRPYSCARAYSSSNESSPEAVRTRSIRSRPSPDCGRLQAESRRVEAPGPASRLPELRSIDAPEPEIEILGRAVRTFDESSSHSDEQIRDPERLKRREEGPLSGCEDEFGHG
jgi:hypothetical protein